jgi:tetratricopeptide (TPR) repeat protein
MTNWQDQREARAYLVLGVLLEEMGELDYATGMFRRAASLSPDSVEPRLRWGFLRWRLGDASGMYEAFSEAVRSDPVAVRAAVGEEPEEARLIELVLYPRQYHLPPQELETGAPPEVGEWCDRLTRAESAMAEGREAEAIDSLERMLRENPEDPYPVPLLVLAYLLLGTAGGGEGQSASEESMLKNIQPGLATLLFRS